MEFLDQYIMLSEMPTKGAFTEVWTANGHSCSRSLRWYRDDLLQWEGWEEEDKWIVCVPLNDEQIKRIYIVAKD